MGFQTFPEKCQRWCCSGDITNPTRRFRIFPLGIFFSKITCTVVHLRSVWVSYLDVESCRGQNACNYQGWVSCYPGVFNAMVWACTSPLMGEHMMLKISFVIAKTSVHFLSCTNYWKMPFSCRICCNSYLQMLMTTNRCAVMEYWGRMFY